MESKDVGEGSERPSRGHTFLAGNFLNFIQIIRVQFFNFFICRGRAHRRGVQRGAEIWLEEGVSTCFVFILNRCLLKCSWIL